RGHSVTLVSGPVALTPPKDVEVVRVVTAADMLAAVKLHLKKCDALIMAAAVADWQPVRVAKRKMKKGAEQRLTLELKRTPDILKTIAPLKGKKIFIGFAAETHETNRVMIFDAHSEEQLPLLSKRAVAERILDRIENCKRV
ncbi:MAG: phosphopantothenoylcysteine decarboxylase, partial [Kiritimatiellaeota bacterium]|nr:phosphopantothenoylcysteine decarboxylase [Kiritimatiellota bacterium]